MTVQRDAPEREGRRAFLADAARASALLTAATAGQPAAAAPAGGFVSVRDFGALGTGNSAKEDQAGFVAALDHVAKTGRYIEGVGGSYWGFPQGGIFIPPGVYDIAGLAIRGNRQPFPALSLWAMPGTVVLRIAPDAYGFESEERLNWVHVHGISFVRGRGAFRLGFQGDNVNGLFAFERCVFDDYTQCAIGNNAADAPQLRVRDCSFMAAERSAAIGIAWGGYADEAIIENNSFLRNRYHLKLGPRLSGSIHILRNSFLMWDKVTPGAAAIWIVPNSDAGAFGTNSGWGSMIAGNKFGNENMSGNEPRILVAVEGAGGDRLSRHHLERFDGGGAGGAFVSGWTIRDSRISCVAATRSPFIRSWIAELRGLSFTNNRHDGGRHSYLCEFMGRRGDDFANMDWNVAVSPADTMLGSSPWSLGVSNALMVPLPDTGGALALDETTILPATGGDETSLRLLARADRTDGFLASAPDVVLVAANDHRGATRAAEVTVRRRRTGIAATLVDAAGGRQGWLAVDLKRALVSPAIEVEVAIFNFATGVTAMRRRFAPSEQWRRLRVPFTLPHSDSPATWQVLVQVADAPIGASSFQIARLYVYHGREPTTDGHLATLGDGKWDGAHLVMGSTHVWEEGGTLYVKAGGAPAGPTDGRALA